MKFLHIFSLLNGSIKKSKNQGGKLKKKVDFCKDLCKIIVGDRQQPKKP